MKGKNSIIILIIIACSQPMYGQQWVSNGNNYTTGNLGIGLSSAPSGRVHIRDGAFWSSYNYGAALVIDGPHNNAIGILDANNSNPFAIANASGTLTFAKMPSLGDVSNPPVHILSLNSTGKVVIGSPGTPPEGTLEVYSSTDAILKIRNEPYSNGFTELSLETKEFASPGNQAGLINNVSGSAQNGIPTETFGVYSRWRPMVFVVGNGTGNLYEYMRITQYGSLLINKVAESSSYKLDVNGRVRANELVINTTGADFVFENSYKLMSLAEVEEYINLNKHLPEIPSAKEMQENGAAVGELQTKLLQKVEELTLYLIELKKENEAQDALIKTLTKKLNNK